MLRIVFDVPRLKAKRKELEQISAQPQFWENQEAAKKQMLILDVTQQSFLLQALRNKAQEKLQHQK